LTQAGKGLVTIDTPRTKALTGFADNRPVTLGGITLRAGTTQLGWCTLGMTLTRGEVFTNDCAALIVATGWWENTGQVWTDSTKVSVGNQWGRSPVLTEVVPFSLTLPVGTNHVSAWVLDERGQRRAALPVSGDAARTTLTISTNAGSIWYELNVARWIASYELWRSRYFSPTEQTNAAISGEGARPDGDNIPNLLKYYLGLPGRAPAPASRLPAGARLTVAGEEFLALTYSRDSLAEDTACVGQTSPDLVHWSADSTLTQFGSIAGPGALQAMTVRDLLPIGSLPARFLRFQLQRR
jgi:hypothetical protein